MKKKYEIQSRTIKAPSLLQKLEYLEKKVKEPKKQIKSRLPDWLQGVD